MSISLIIAESKKRITILFPKRHIQGFTIVELLIVIVVIGILVAITIVAYNGISQKAIGASLQSDLKNASTQLKIYQVDNGSFPTSNDCGGGVAPTPPKICLKSSSGNTYSTYSNPTPQSFSLTATRDSISYTITDSTPPTLVVSAGEGSNTGIVTTLAGGVKGGSSDGTGSSASFYWPMSLAVDSTGIVYVADSWNHTIRKITPGGVVTTLAGRVTGNLGNGFVNGTGSDAEFNYPTGIAVDSAGTVYVADSGNKAIRKITPGGVVTTLAGNGSTGSADGTGSSASFSYPNGITVDSAGTVYVGDVNNNKIRKITSSGVVTTLAGSGSEGSADGTGSGASLYNPFGVVVDSTGIIYVADTGSNKIRKITSSGVVTTLAGTGSVGSTDGAGISASFNHPYGVAVDSTGTVYVIDTDNCLIRKIK